ncbi:winged helix-turn-helix transcriptional regulator [Taklimakanibacter lacteus]|uniref:winged helix-turn-helix transcriptional regulator n=1 Tax=Taklimakanibacter lacteus TaxID=2268456 RepID=UPI000E675954
MLTMANEAKQLSRETLQCVSENRAIIRELLDHVGDELTLRVTWRLAEAPAGLRELRRLVDGISQRKLTLSLRQLIRNGLAVRRHTETFPSRAEYSLTPLGVMFLEQVKELVRWVDDHGKEIQSARTRFEKRSYKWLGLTEAQL